MPNAVITGGSKGLGRALALRLADDGWDVVITARSQHMLDDVARDGSLRILAIAGDIRDESHRVRLANAVGQRLDLLVNNASHLGPSPLLPIGAVGEDELHAVFDTNVVSPLALLGHLLPALKQGDGVVVNVSSDAAVEAYETWGPYGASKSALDHASAVLAREEPGLRVYAFDPGDMRTDMHQAAFPDEDISDRPPPETVVPLLRDLISSGLPSERYTAGGLLAEVR
ncbi:MAG: SDR family oxidoreductase [Acidimicrobiia bacterium]|nr:SDR family oxidoreductase [Acidimicrobiia bacterium]